MAIRSNPFAFCEVLDFYLFRMFRSDPQISGNFFCVIPLHLHHKIITAHSQKSLLLHSSLQLELYCFSVLIHMSDEPFTACNAARLRQASGFLAKSVANCEDQKMDKRLLRSN